MRSFLRVTGPKQDLWLVRTAGVLIAAIGGGLIIESKRDTTNKALNFIAASSALGLAGIDVIYASKGVISKIYLAEALVELPFIVKRFLR
jgi:hypothetical protein